MNERSPGWKIKDTTCVGKESRLCTEFCQHVKSFKWKRVHRKKKKKDIYGTIFNADIA